jgi:hypothetical protein
MRRELILRLDHACTGGDMTLLGSVQLAIDAIDAEQERPVGSMPVSESCYAEIFENLRLPGFEQVSVSANGDIDLRGVRLVRLPGVTPLAPR